MAQQFDSLKKMHVEFIKKQQMFFVGTAGAQGLVNVSPKGMDSLRVMDNNTIVWLNLSGSGNESAAHVLENQRMTLMFCSFDKKPLIMRLYGHAKTTHQRDPEWAELSQLFPEYSFSRQIFTVSIDMVQTSCGYAVPYYELQGERDMLTRFFSAKEGKSSMQDYWEEKNQLSLDGKPTGIFE
jgi:hypothetical protein